VDTHGLTLVALKNDDIADLNYFPLPRWEIISFFPLPRWEGIKGRVKNSSPTPD
jgi:hypothetical protein